MKILLILAICILTQIQSISQDCDTINIFKTHQKFPAGLASDGDMVWVCGTKYFGDTISIITVHDEFGNQLNSFYPSQDSSIRINTLEIQEDTLWAVSQNRRTLYKLNKESGEILDNFELPTFYPNSPNNYGLCYGEKYLWNIEYGGLDEDYSYLYKIDPKTGIPIDTIFVPVSDIGQIEYINGAIYGLSFQGEDIFKIDKESGDTTYLFDWCLDHPYGFDLWDQNTLIGISSYIPFGGTQSVYKVTELDLLTSNINANSAKKFNVSIYPNPIKDYIKISLDVEEELSIRIFKSTGVQCFYEKFTGDSFEKNISDYPAGIYYIQIESVHKLHAEKFIKLL